jgi:hypothetical protein
LGWRTPVRTTAWKEFERGAVGDAAEWKRVTGIEPLSLEDALRQQPVSVQERWFARLYLLKPLVFALFSVFWIMTAIVSVGPGFERGVALMQEGGAGSWAGPSVFAGAFADLIIGVGIAFRRTTRIALLGAVALTLFYVVTGTILVPRLWRDPVGPMLKILPILALNFVALAIREDR